LGLLLVMTRLTVLFVS